MLASMYNVAFIGIIIVLLTFTWFLLLAHVANVLSGAARAVGFLRGPLGRYADVLSAAKSKGRRWQKTTCTTCMT